MEFKGFFSAFNPLQHYNSFNGKNLKPALIVIQFFTAVLLHIKLTGAFLF